MDFKYELKRKLFHQSSLIIPLSYFFLDKKTMVYALGIATLIFFLGDILRFRIKFIRKMTHKFFYQIIRKHETRTLLGSTYVLIGALTTVFLFEKWIAITSLFYLTVSDSLAAVVGKKFGKIRINKKSFSGSLAFLVSGFLIGLLVTQLTWKIALIGAFFTAIIELFVPKYFDDNLVIPTAGGFILHVFSKLPI